MRVLCMFPIWQEGTASRAAAGPSLGELIPCLQAALALVPASWLFHQDVAVAAAQQGQELQLTIASQQQQSQQEQQEERKQQAQALRDAVVVEEMLGLVGVVEVGWALGPHPELQGYWGNAMVQLLALMDEHNTELLPEVGVGGERRGRKCRQLQAPSIAKICYGRAWFHEDGLSALAADCCSVARVSLLA
jgi:hypothetical protein